MVSSLVECTSRAASWNVRYAVRCSGEVPKVLPHVAVHQPWRVSAPGVIDVYAKATFWMAVVSGHAEHDGGPPRPGA
jgi:hypothetical protein